MSGAIATAAIVSGTALAGSVVKGIAASKAAGEQASAAQDAANGVNAQYQQNRTDQQPYMSAGSNAINTVNSDLQNGTGFAKQFSMNDFTNNPAYQFQLQQGQNAVNSSAAATGGSLNGGTLKALQQYSQGLANTTYGDAYNRYLSSSNQSYNQLMGVANLGENATSTLGNQGIQSANSAGNFLTQKGNAQAAGTIGVGNAINSGLGAIGSLPGVYNQALATQSAKSSYGTGLAGESSNPYNND